MKTLFLLLFVVTYHTGALAEYNDTLHQSPVAVRAYPKKVAAFSKNPKLLHRKFNKKKYSSRVIKESNVKIRDYTAFPPQDVRLVDIPNSPYFPLDMNDEPKARVKKVLPDYAMVRKKRDAGPAPTTADSSAKPADPVSSTTVTAKTVSVADPANKPNPTPSVPSKTTTKKPSKLTTKKDKKKKIKRSGSSKKSRKSKSRKTKSKTRSKSRQAKAIHKDETKKIKRSGPKSHKKADTRRKPKKAERRLIAARDGTIEAYPYAISIQKGNEHWCSGAILNSRLIITTANCLWKSSRTSRLRVRVCSRHTDRGGQLLRIQELRKHPHWSIRHEPDADVALALVDRNIRFSDSCHAVDLPNRIMMPPFEDAWITSWGAERPDGIFEHRAMTMQVYHSRLIPREKCNNMTKRFGVAVSENFICFAQTGRRAPCTRDTGAPAVSDGVLWGMASWGIRKLCGTERFPAMFSYVASQDNMDFIINATSQLMQDERNYPFLDKYPDPAPGYRKSNNNNNKNNVITGLEMVESATAPNGNH